MTKKIFNIIDKISREHNKKTFGYLNKDDLKNEIWVICLEMIKEYDKSKGELEHFLRVGVKNRLINRFKDITKSVRSPCPRCEFFRESGDPDSCKKFHLERELCSKWKNYKMSTDSRNSLLNAAEQQYERFSGENLVNNIISSELKNFIESKINIKFLHDFRELISGSKISKKKMAKLKVEINNLLNENNDAVIDITVNGKELERQGIYIPKVRPNEDKSAYLKRCLPYVIKNEGLTEESGPKKCEMLWQKYIEKEKKKGKTRGDYLVEQTGISFFSQPKNKIEEDKNKKKNTTDNLIDEPPSPENNNVV